MKTCTVCNKEKETFEFEHWRNQCKECRAAKLKITRRAWYIRNQKHAITYSKKWRLAHPEHKKAYRKAEYAKNKEAAKEASRIYRKENPEKINAWSRKRQCAKAQRTPIWVDKEHFWMIEETYRLAKLREKIFGFPWHVDHIIPLRGKLVSGLHVIENLQVIPGKANIEKRNTFEIT